ncbi:protein phosphatase 1 regulatory subunit 12B [Diaphorina citri]|uniref:Protein phosphatase 1 regulatory subunit 12B n=1 Tax=Diaphorina citri TaxID=121845 RepID=A0A3Q0IIG5_DIACI|nr:protein phosphatase 1 regulatory subunit 12B [Diaphorina citri]
MSETRSSSALFKRAEQLKRWEESETNRQPSEMGNKPKKIKFSSGCVFLAACASSDKEEVLNLLKSGADINTANVDGLTALHQVSKSASTLPLHDKEEVLNLLKSGADINTANVDGLTALHQNPMSETRSSSALFKRAEQLKRWEESETNRQPSEMGNKPKKIKFSSGCVFLAACASSDKEEVLNLLKSGADINTANVDGLTALHQIYREAPKMFPKNSQKKESQQLSGKTLNVQSGGPGILIQAGADLNFQDYDGWTPLHAAAHWAQREACQILVENFCDMDVKNYVGQTCFDIADVELVSFLEDLRKKQASMERSQQDINNIASKQQQQRNNILPKRRLSSDRSPLSKAGGEAPHTPSGGGDGSVTIGGEEDATPADKMAKVEVRDRKMDTSSGAPGGGDRNEQAFGSEDEEEEDSSSVSSVSTSDDDITSTTRDDEVLEGEFIEDVL